MPEVGARKLEEGASVDDAGASEYEELTRFVRVVRFGLITELITLVLRGEAITLVFARPPGCDAAHTVGASCAIVSQLRSEMSPNAAVHA